jgi:hypothetical protein
LYAAYYNQMRTHLALGKDAPLGRAVERSGVIVAIPILSGLHRQYAGYDFRKGQVHRTQIRPLWASTFAAPVFDHRGVIVGSIAIVGSTQVIARKPVPTELGAVVEAARSVSRDLGWKGKL